MNTVYIVLNFYFRSLLVAYILTLIYYITIGYEYDNKKHCANTISMSICVILSLCMFLFFILYDLFFICGDALYQVVNINISKY